LETEDKNLAELSVRFESFVAKQLRVLLRLRVA
jgi:hypothetical protein